MGKVKTQRRSEPGMTDNELEEFMEKCPYCLDRYFEDQSDAREHLASHNPGRPEVCTQCAKGFTQKTALQTHKNTHSGNKPHKCRMGCDARFGDPSSRNRHEQDVHDHSYSHRCSHCKKSIKRRAQFAKHFMSCLGRQPTDEEVVAARATYKEEYMTLVRLGEASSIPERKSRTSSPPYAENDTAASPVSLPEASMSPAGRTDDQSPVADHHYYSDEDARSDNDYDMRNDEPNAPSTPTGTLDPEDDLGPLPTDFGSPRPSPSHESESVSPRLRNEGRGLSLLLFAMLENPMRVRDIVRGGSPTESSGGSVASGSPPSRQGAIYSAELTSRLVTQSTSSPQFLPAQNVLGLAFPSPDQGVPDVPQPAPAPVPGPASASAPAPAQT